MNKNIPASFDNFIFLSPHFDDAVLSCGLLLEKLNKSKKNILVVTLFTKASKKPYNEDAKKFVFKSGFTNAERLFLARKIEDINSLKLFKAKHIHLDFTDTVFRNHNFLLDMKLEKELFNATLEMKSNPKTLVLAPLGVGGHSDHLLINKLVKKFNWPAVFWEDFPYNTNLLETLKFYNSNPQYKTGLILASSNKNVKFKAIKKYKSQMNVLFKKRVIPSLPEKYFYLRNSRTLTNFFTEFREV